MSNPKEIYFTEVLGIPVLYDRLKPEDYGKNGVEYKFYCTRRLKKKFEESIRQVRAIFGFPRAILLGGTYVDKPGMHGLGRALDLDAILWDYDRIPKNSPLHSIGDFVVKDSPKNWVLSLGIEACFRKKFGVVLTPFYNRAHRDHFHVDDSVPVRFNRDSRSNVLFVQAVARYFYGQDIAIDGVYGPQTEKALELLAKRYWITNDIRAVIDNWGSTLSRIARDSVIILKQEKEFIGEIEVKTPLELIHNVYDEIDILNKRGIDVDGVLRALNEFANNEETQAWLANYR